jgi:hypothetical protein
LLTQGALQSHYQACGLRHTSHAPSNDERRGEVAFTAFLCLGGASAPVNVIGHQRPCRARVSNLKDLEAEIEHLKELLEGSWLLTPGVIIALVHEKVITTESLVRGLT